MMLATSCDLGGISVTTAGPVVSSFIASPSSIAAGESSDISWNVTGANSVSIDQGIGNVPLAGSRAVNPSATTVYTLTATSGSGVSVTATTQVVVTGTAIPPTPSVQPVIYSFTANPTNIYAGNSSTLSWKVSNATSISIDHGIGTVGPIGETLVFPVISTTYTLTATNAAGFLTKGTTVFVSRLSLPPSPSPYVGGSCQYMDIPGIATIVSVETAPTTDYNCGNAVRVIFDFVPNDPAAINNYRFLSWLDTGNYFTVGAGMNPPQTWVLQQGLTAGSQHACVRSEITSGACTPVIFSFPDINETGWEQECFGTGTEP